LQNWQLREYRWDRIKAYFSTTEGKINLFNLWFFRGILPRPKFSGRIILITLITIFLLITDYFTDHYFAKICESTAWWCEISRDFANLEFFWKVLIYERFLWAFIGLAVFISAIPVNFKKRKLYAKAREIIQNSKSGLGISSKALSPDLKSSEIKIIGITGSYGKSSTRSILTHLLRQEFGVDSVLTNPENHNTEVSIARLILKSREFFENHKSGLGVSSKSLSPGLVLKKFLIIEIGAYRKGEIATVCDFLQPEIGILTGINNQHIALFGSQKNIVEGKFELAESCSEKVFFNADNQFLSQIFADKKIQAVPIGISRDSAKILKSEIDQTIFQLYGKEFVLPWGGEFFVDNAILAIETARELGCKIENLAKNLKTLPPLEKALNIEKSANGGFILKDLYSQNPDGVLAAIEHLGKFRGKLIFVGTPLLELGKDSEKIHHEIFTKLAEIKAEVFWLKDEFTELGKEICGKRFHGQNPAKLAKIRKNLKKGDVILFTGRLDKDVLKG
jgi:UDP-N-acetylmuramyl pentapeptide synthase